MALPDLDDQPKVEGMPQGCAWGVFDTEKGKKDFLGTLNLLTPDVVKAAGSKVTDGISVSLKSVVFLSATSWMSLTKTNAAGRSTALKQSFFGRKQLVHKVHSFINTPLASHIWDDEVEFNTQCSSHWDSLCHFLHQPSGLAYNGIACPSAEAFTKQTTEEVEQPTLDHWHARGGLVARGVLIDYKAWADAQGKECPPFAPERITVDELEAVAKHQGVEFRHGDVLVVRTGYTEALTELGADEQPKALSSGKGCIGVHGSVDTARWVWNKHFAAVSGDMHGFEAIPPVKEDGTEANPAHDLGPSAVGSALLHSYFLSMFGMPIGELWDLKRLSEVCKQLGRYSFLLTSVPLHMPGLVGSPPNALAIF
ncbi:hypothetical protein AURDEDRAFT_126090 [Auricularia subglabra TFB-10046 SS5]|nr:hypothetical protein AURDEDRAFT_126090 [Auricularia subglabra TFB-10046 SS5]